MPLLAICVPIWNSIREVDRTVSAIRELLALNSAQIEIAISDNCSDDGTWERLVEANLTSWPNLKIARQESNLGFRGNLLALSNMTSCEFVWFLGAGERIDTKFLLQIVNFLDEESPSVLVLSGQIESSEGLGLDVGVVEDLEFKTFVSGFPYSETISMNVFKSSEVRSCLRAPKRSSVMDDSWPHLEIASSAWANGSVYFQTGSPVVEISTNPHGWWFHGVTALEVYGDKLVLGLDNPKIFNSMEYRRLAGVGAALHAFEVRVNGQTQSRDSFLRFRKLVSPPWLFMVDLIFLSPKPVLLLAQKLKHQLVRSN